MGKAAKAGTPALEVEVVPIDSLTLSPRQAQSLLRELAREVTLAAEVTTLDHVATKEAER